MDNKQKIEKTFQIGIELAEKIVATSKSLNASDGEDFAYKGAMFFFFCKAYKSYQAIRLLWEKGFTEDAFILTRTIFELALQSGYMKEDPKPRARLFTEHDPVSRYRYYQELKKLDDFELIKDIESKKQELSDLKKYYDKFQKKYPKGKGWWGRSIKWLADNLGEHMKKRYAVVYWMESNLIHSNVTAIKEYLSDDPAALTVNCYPKALDDPAIPMEATTRFLMVSLDVNEALDLKLGDAVARAFTEFTKLWKENEAHGEPIKNL
jgi:Family of unknown function (DUF5677)